MGLGLRGGGDSADIIPIVKFDARAGKMFRNDRTEGAGGWENNQVEITADFKAVFDMENVEVGWLRFDAGSAPDFRLFPIGADYGARPSDGHREGFRVMMKLSKSAGGDVREFCSAAKVCIGAFNELHDNYEAESKAHPGMLPVVVIEKTRPVVTGSGTTRSTNYAPVFKIESWTPRPESLVFKPKSAKAAANGSGAPATPSAPVPGTPPATGSTRVPPPQPQPPPQPAAGAEDFG